MDDDDDEEEELSVSAAAVVSAAPVVSSRPKPVKPEDRYIADASVIGTSTTYDDYFADEKAAIDAAAPVKESGAKKARVAHKMIVCDGQDAKIQVCTAIRLQDSHHPIIFHSMRC